ncbi:MAG: hypothetical protein HC812_20305, partial [Leptolyngbya sp. RL_3_1]|nr:hypothetical protein [Leptolyngbya sp. RL_3_1]
MVRHCRQLGVVLAGCLSLGAVWLGPVGKLPVFGDAVAWGGPARIAEADQRREAGLQQFQTDQIEPGILNLEAAVGIYRDTGSTRREANALDNLSYMYSATGQYDAAIAAAQRWL